MQKQTVEGTLIRSDDTHLVMQEDNGTIATYSRHYYRLPMDYGMTCEPRAIVKTNALPTKLEYGLDGAILVPS